MKIKSKIRLYIKSRRSYKISYSELKKRIPIYKVYKYKIKHLETNKTFLEPVIFIILT
jgi:hypothetical protein